MDRDQECTIITGTASSDDANYDSLDPVDVTAVNTDDDTIVTGSDNEDSSGNSGGGGCFIGSLQM